MHLYFLLFVIRLFIYIFILFSLFILALGLSEANAPYIPYIRLY